MRDLFIRMTALDPLVAGDVRVIDYFDRLAAAHLPAPALVKEAALLAQCTVGYRGPDGSCRINAAGDVAAADDSGAEQNGALPVGDHGQVWLEPGARTAPNAQLVLERLALALTASQDQRSTGPAPTAAAEILLAPGPDTPAEERVAAWARLRLEPSGLYRAIAIPLSVAPPPGWPHAVIPTPWGPMRGVIVRDGIAWTTAGGVGVAVSPWLLDRSWTSAIIALRLADTLPAAWADDLGAHLPALEADTSPDAFVVERALQAGWDVAGLQAFADGASLRGIAAAAGLHHSTVQTRLFRLASVLGFDPHQPLGRVRLQLALMRHRIAADRDEDRPPTLP